MTSARSPVLGPPALRSRVVAVGVHGVRLGVGRGVAQVVLERRSRLLLLVQEQRDGDRGQQADDHHDDEQLDEGEATLTVALLLERFLEHVTLQGLSVVGRLLPDPAPFGRCRGATFPPVIGGSRLELEADLRLKTAWPNG